MATSSLTGAPRGAGAGRRVRIALDRYSGLIVLAGLIVGFGLWIPDLFLTGTNFRAIAGDEAITALLALALVVTLSGGVFDLSIAGTMGLAAVTVMKLLSMGASPVLAIAAAIGVACVVGGTNGFVVTRLHVDSFIATLGMGSITAAATYWVSGGKQLLEGIPPSFLRIARQEILGISVPVYYLLVAAGILWFILERRPEGRRLYAVGGNPVAARLAGIRVERTIVLAFIVGSAIAGFTGVLLASRLGTASPDIGLPYLLPAFTAAFLGATQVHPGRFNPFGTLIAVYLLAVGVKGLQLAGSPSYINDLFNGLALIVAVALAARGRR
jgi:ribose transport system permease protein